MSNVLDWQKGIRNRNYFVLRELLRQNIFDQVVLVDFLSILPVKRSFGKHRTWEYAKWWHKQAVQKTGMFHGLTKLDGKALFGVSTEIKVFTGLGYFSSSERILEQLNVALGELGIFSNNLLVWSYDPFLPQVLEIRAKKTVFDTVDNWSEHASYKREAALLRSNYEQIREQADLIFTVSDGLKNLFPGRKSHWIPNGIDVEEFVNVPQSPPKNSVPQIGYVGTIQERVDFDLIRRLCLDHPEKHFVFYGPIWSGVEKQVEDLKKRCQNCVFPGRVLYKDLPNVLADLDVAIIPHRLDAFLESTNPMKMYDYLAAGKPVVTTPGAGTEQFSDLLYIEENPTSFSRAIDKALLEDSSELIAERRSRVKMHTWEIRVKEMLSLIDVPL